MLFVANVLTAALVSFRCVLLSLSDVSYMGFSSSYSSDPGRFYLPVIDVELRVASDHTQ